MKKALKQQTIIYSIYIMAALNTLAKHDDYMTPFYAWDNIKQFLPKDKVIWEAFYGNGKSGEYLEQLGHKVIHENIDFFENDKGDYIVSNPPFSLAKKVMPRLKKLNKPFVLIMPVSKMNTVYMRENFMNELQVIIPPKRINFDKMVNGEIVETKGANFDCYYYCYKMNLPKDMVWLPYEKPIEKKKKIKIRVNKKIEVEQ